ncbi:MAG: hypothetical protein GY816_19305 [Cytophagales bacterium]|nr:hypothetical protein [Cytophagales bacterium]
MLALDELRGGGIVKTDGLLLHQTGEFISIEGDTLIHFIKQCIKII